MRSMVRKEDPRVAWESQGRRWQPREHPAMAVQTPKRPPHSRHWLACFGPPLSAIWVVAEPTEPRSSGPCTPWLPMSQPWLRGEGEISVQMSHPNIFLLGATLSRLCPWVEGPASLGSLFSRTTSFPGSGMGPAQFLQPKGGNGPGHQALPASGFPVPRTVPAWALPFLGEP